MVFRGTAHMGARISVMRPGGGLRFTCKRELTGIEVDYHDAVAKGADESEAASIRDRPIADLRHRYEREPMNPSRCAVRSESTNKR